MSRVCQLPAKIIKCRVVDAAGLGIGGRRGSVLQGEVHDLKESRATEVQPASGHTQRCRREAAS